jgi:hypothetical protein
MTFPRSIERRTLPLPRREPLRAWAFKKRLDSANKPMVRLAIKAIEADGWHPLATIDIVAGCRSVP